MSEKPSAAHEAFWRQVRDMVQEMVDASAPTLATVKGRDRNGNVLVQMDDEDVPRSVGMARKSGVRHANGDRVVVVPTRSGDHVILGPVATGGGNNAERAVGTDQMLQGAVTSDILSDSLNNKIAAGVDAKGMANSAQRAADAAMKAATDAAKDAKDRVKKDVYYVKKDKNDKLYVDLT